MEIRDRIKHLRKDILNMNQTDFGSAIGLNQSTIGGYETGLRSISDASILAICKEFNVNESWLRTGQGEMFIQKTRNQEIEEFVESVLADSEQSFRRRFIAMLSALDTSGWEVLERMAIALTEKKEPSLTVLRAAHNDNAEDPEELAKINRDLNNLKRP